MVMADESLDQRTAGGSGDGRIVRIIGPVVDVEFPPDA